jgi:hypothetical protein
MDAACRASGGTTSRLPCSSFRRRHKVARCFVGFEQSFGVLSI